MKQNERRARANEVEEDIITLSHLYRESKSKEAREAINKLIYKLIVVMHKLRYSV